MKIIFTALSLLLASLCWLPHPAGAQEHALRMADARILIMTGEKEYAFLGIYSEQISSEKARKLGCDNYYGSYVTRVIHNSAAERDGIQPFDYIYGVEEYRTAEGQSLAQILRRYEPGQKANILLYRQGRKQIVPATLGSRPTEDLPKRSECQRAFFGVSPKDIPEGQTEGVAITTIRNSTAVAMGLEDGDVILSINGYHIIDWQDIAIAIDNMEVGQKITVAYRRNSKPYKGSQAIRSHCETKSQSQWEAPVAPEPGNWFNRHFYPQENETWNTVSPNLSVKIESLQKQDAQRLNQEKNMSLSMDNTLPVERLSISVLPGNKQLHITCYLPQSGNTTFRLFNASGRAVYKYELGQFTGQFSDEVSLTQNRDGAYYYLDIQQGRRSLVKKIRVSGP